MRLLEATKSEILSNSGLYSEMIRIMKTADGAAPKGACCGKNKEQHVEQFIKNKNYYMEKAEEIKNRTIKPKWKGIIYVSKMKTHYDSETITDAKSRLLIEQNVLTPVEDYFELPENYETDEAIPVMTKEEQAAFDKEYDEFIEDLKKKPAKKAKSKRTTNKKSDK